MGWLLSEGTVVAAIAIGLLLATSHGLRRLVAQAARSAGRRAGFVPPPPLCPEHRPIEAVVQDARRLHRRYLDTRRGVSFAKSEAFRRAYDDVLAEGCDALGIAHLLGVLDGGTERDAERQRVEGLLRRWGIDLEAA